MPVTDGFIAFAIDQLAAVGPVTSKRMFGGAGLYAGDVFFAILAGDRLYLKVNDSNRGDFEAAGMGPFRPYGDDSEVMQYYEVPLAVLEDADDLGRWARQAVAVAVAARTRKRVAGGASKRIAAPTRKRVAGGARKRVTARRGKSGAARTRKSPRGKPRK